MALSAESIITYQKSNAATAISEARSFLQDMTNQSSSIARIGTNTLAEEIVGPVDKGVSSAFLGTAPTVDSSTEVQVQAYADGRNTAIAETEIESLASVEIAGESSINSVDPNVAGVGVYDQLTGDIEDIDVDINDNYSYNGTHITASPSLDSIGLEADQDANITPLNSVSIDALSIVGFDEDAPTISAAMPTNSFDFVETEYSSSLLAAIDSLLRGDINNGGYGINTEDELALFGRTRDREAATFRNNAEKIQRRFSARGLKVTSTAMAGLISMAQDQYQKAVSSVNRDIMLKQSDVYLQARQFAVQQGITLESALINYHNAKMERLLNFNKSIQEFAINFYELALRKFEAELNGWKQAASNVFELNKNEVLKLEKARLQIEENRSITAQNNTEIAYLGARNDAVKAADSVRNTGLRLHELLIQRDRLYLEDNRALIESFGRQIQADELKLREAIANSESQHRRIDGDRFQLEASKANIEKAARQAELEIRDNELLLEQSKHELNRSQAEVGKAKSTADARISATQISVSELSALIDREKLTLEQSARSLALALDKSKVLAGIYGQDITKWAEELKANSDYHRIFTTATSAADDQRVRSRIAELQNNIQQSRNDAELLGMKINALGKGADVYAGYVSGSLNSISGMVQYLEQA